MRDRILFAAALVVIAGVVLSGPAAVALLAFAAPQPPWSDVETFAAHYRPLQGLPYLFGFVLLGGFVAFMARAASAIRARHEMRAATATVATAVFATLVFVNYTLQLAWVPAAARARSPFLELFTMANPTSICWSFEMFGYAALGIAMWLVVPAFAGRWIHGLIATNAVASIASAGAAAADPSWLMTPLGLFGYAVWNALVVAIMVLVAIEARRGTRVRHRALEPRSALPSAG